MNARQSTLRFNFLKFELFLTWTLSIISPGMHDAVGMLQAAYGTHSL